MTQQIPFPSSPGVEPHKVMKPSFDLCWFDAPHERSHEYFPAFVRVSIAVQAALRRALPERYLSDIERFRDTRMIYPLLVYMASRPFPGQPRTEFTYDVVNRELMRKFNLSVGRNLPAVLAAVSARLRAAGLGEVAAHYRADRASTILATVNRLKICRRRLEALLVTESLMINHLLLFAGSRSLPPAARAKIVAKCEKVWLSRLRRLFAKQDYTFLAPEILAAATEALQAAGQTGTSLRVPPVSAEKGGHPCVSPPNAHS